MRRYILMGVVLVVAVLSVSLLVSVRRERAHQSVPQAGTGVVTIPVEGMACLACTARVKSALKGIDGVTDVEVKLEKRAAHVRYVQGKVSGEQLVSAINGLGYKAGIPQPEEAK